MATKTRRFRKHPKRRYRRDPTRRNSRFVSRPPLYVNPAKETSDSKKLAIDTPPQKNNEYSPVSSPGTSNNNTALNSPITKKAKELAALYPNTRAMLRRATSFNNSGMTNDEFYAMLERELGTSNNWAS
jgi:hypothetical protein